jgi:hypothetical protein
MKTSHRMMEGLALLAVATFNVQLSIAYSQSLITTNWNDLITNWTQTRAPTNTRWSSIASSSDGIKLAAACEGGIYTSIDAGVTWIQTSAPSEGWGGIVSSSDGTRLAAVVANSGIWTAQATIPPTTETVAGVVVDGPVGTNYLIQAASDLPGNWTTLTNVALPWQPYLYIDYSSPTNAQQFYRAVLAP